MLPTPLQPCRITGFVTPADPSDVTSLMPPTAPAELSPDGRSFAPPSVLEDYEVDLEVGGVDGWMGGMQEARVAVGGMCRRTTKANCRWVCEHLTRGGGEEEGLAPVCGRGCAGGLQSRPASKAGMFTRVPRPALPAAVQPKGGLFSGSPPDASQDPSGTLRSLLQKGK